MARESSGLWIAVLLTVAVIGGLWYYTTTLEPVPMPPEPAEPAAVEEPPPTKEGPLHPLPEPSEPERPDDVRPLPDLADSDEFLKLELSDVVGSGITPMLTDTRIIEKIVATIDNLPRKHVAERMRPVSGVDGPFPTTAMQSGDVYALDPEGYRRFDAVVEMITNADLPALVALYRRYYPLFQDAYANLGYPNSYFNDRVVEVIDDMQQAPVPEPPILLVRTHVLYEFADPLLENASSGQKLLIRMGPDNARAVKAKLLELRALLTAEQVLPDDAQAISLTGQILRAQAPSQDTLDKLAQAEEDYRADPQDADNIIWYGRRIAYTGDYRRAIDVFSEGIRKHPQDARMYRHRGHRYISVRDFPAAIADLGHAAELIEGTENEIEPDGLPNAQNIPVSTLHGNIWYHLGLAYYLMHDWENAWTAYQRGFETSGNDDNIVSTTHWRYMILRRMGRRADASGILDDISADMNVIENTIYHRLCLFYKGEIPLSEMTADIADNPGGAAGAYGIANWHYYNGETDKATAMMRDLLATDSWAAFGYIAAEADLAAL